jgi:hypothetical protein
LSVFGDIPKGFPELPILNQGELPALTQREKYGGLFYLGIGGLLVLVVLVGWFSYGVWSIRDVFTDVYMLHDSTRPEAERDQAAFRLTPNARLNDTQLMQMSLERDLPDLARYLLAEAVSTDAVAHDPRSYALTVARSPDWPDWLRLLLTRRLAYGVGRGYAIPREPLEELARHADPMITLWATYALAELADADPRWVAELWIWPRSGCAIDTPRRPRSGRGGTSRMGDWSRRPSNDPQPVQRFSSKVSRTQLRADLDERCWMMSRGCSEPRSSRRVSVRRAVDRPR